MIRVQESTVRAKKRIREKRIKVGLENMGEEIIGHTMRIIRRKVRKEDKEEEKRKRREAGKREMRGEEKTRWMGEGCKAGWY